MIHTDGKRTIADNTCREWGSFPRGVALERQELAEEEAEKPIPLGSSDPFKLGPEEQGSD